MILNYYIFIFKISIILIIIFPFKNNSKKKLFICIYNKKNLTKFIDFKKINKAIILKEKKELLKHISYCNKKKIKNINSIFLNFSRRFGNQLIILNKAIFYCEILGCKRILLIIFYKIKFY